jgi:hypothetical protein
MADTIQSAKSNLIASQEKMKKQVDGKRRDLEFEVGTQIPGPRAWIATCGLPFVDSLLL